MAYYNTTAETQNQCNMFNESNMKQDDLIFEVAIRLKRPFTASDIYKNYPVANTPLTSIRRGINTLCHKLEKIRPTGRKVNGMFGRPELQYRILE